MRPAYPDPAYPDIVAPPRITFHPPNGSPSTLPCTNCASPAPKSPVLTVVARLPRKPPETLTLLRCPTCGAHVYDRQIPRDYADETMNDRGRVPFYVQQGAGLGLITRPLAQLRRPPGAHFMEVGCGYGFGLDYALHANAWHGVGIDPAPLAAIGRDALRLPIEQRYLREDDEARGTMDVVMGSEVIEHIAAGPAFVRTLRAMLKPGGVLVLTTPNGDDIRPDTPPGILIPLLSPTLHLVIHTPASLQALLDAAGFPHVHVAIDSHSLLAYASDAPLDLLDDEPALRARLRAYLERRAAASDPAGDPFLAFAARAFTESVNDGDTDAADRAWALLAPACAARYRFSIDAPPALPPALANCSLEQMGHLVPLSLGAILYARAIRRLAAGLPRPALEPAFVLAAEASRALRRALGELAMEDGQAEDLEWTCTAEALLCAADAASPDLAERLAALPPAPNGGAPRARSIALRAMSALVNAGRYPEARHLVRTLHLDEAPFTLPGAPLTPPERDWLFALALLDAAIAPDGGPAGNPAVACPRLRRVRAATPPQSGLWWAALRAEAQATSLIGEPGALAALAERIWAEHPGDAVASWCVVTLTNAGAYAPARAIADAAGLGQAPFAQPGLAPPLTQEERDCIFALAVLGVQDGAPNASLARARFAQIRATLPPGTPSWLATLRGELQAMDCMHSLPEAAALTADIAAAHPEITLPADILARIGQA